MSDYIVEIEQTGRFTWLAKINYGSWRDKRYALGFTKKHAIYAANREIRKFERERQWRANIETFIIEGKNK